MVYMPKNKLEWKEHITYNEVWVIDVFSNKEVAHHILFDGEDETTVCKNCLSSRQEFQERKEQFFNER